MKNPITNIIVLLTIFLANSCRKDKKPLLDGVSCTGNCYILTGKLLDSAANAGIARREIKFYFKDLIGTYSGKPVYLGRTLTEPNGNYSFRFDGTTFKSANGSYYAEAYNGHMFYDTPCGNRVSTFYFDTMFYNIPFNQNFSLFRPAALKLRVVVSTVTNFQYLTISYGYGKSMMG